MHEVVLYSGLSPCPYLDDRMAQMPLRRPIGLTARLFDERLAQGDRRLGRLLYRTACPGCQACEAIRVPVADFHAVRTHARTLRRGDALLELRVGPPECDDQRVDLYNRHKVGRGLSPRDDAIDLDGYYEFLVSTCVETLEFSYWHRGELVAVATSDRGAATLNAVYCFYDPAFTETSLGTYNVLKQIEACRAWSLEYLYLGYYIAASPHMNYKANFKPHERLVGGVWRRFER